MRKGEEEEAISSTSSNRKLYNNRDTVRIQSGYSREMVDEGGGGEKNEWWRGGGALSTFTPQLQCQSVCGLLQNADLFFEGYKR